MGLMDTLTRLRGSLHQRVLHSDPEAPAGPGSCLFLLTFMPLFMKVTLSLCSPNPCLTTFYFTLNVILPEKPVLMTVPLLTVPATRM